MSTMAGTANSTWRCTGGTRPITRSGIAGRFTGTEPRHLPALSSRRRRRGLSLRACAGARWPKMTTAEGQESVHPINALLIWQQPHPFCSSPNLTTAPIRRPATLEKVARGRFSPQRISWLHSRSGTPKTERCVLGPPIYVVSENTDPKITKNPAFELSYWRFGLRIAQAWREAARACPRDSGLGPSADRPRAAPGGRRLLRPL